MNKKYIILGPSRGIGGWQLYVDARHQHCVDLGYDTYVLSSDESMNLSVQLLSLKKGKIINLPELTYPFFVFSKWQIKRVINVIKKAIDYNSYDNVFIESTCMSYTMWGEIFAKELKAVNYGFILSSHIENTSRDVQRFFEFKYDQHLLSGQTEITLVGLFTGYKNVDNYKRGLNASWGPPICDFREDCQVYIEEFRKAKEKEIKIVGYFGSLNKPHFKPLCVELRRYFDNHKDSNFLFVSIGSSTFSISEKYQAEIMEKSSNVYCFNIPTLYPVPCDFFNLMDVCIASWGSANAAARVNKRVIRLMDDVNVIPQGIIGVTLRVNPFYKQPIGDESLEELLDNIFYGNNYEGVEFAYDVVNHAPDENEKKQCIIDDTMKPFVRVVDEYYDMGLIKSRSKLDKIESILCRCLGARITIRIQHFVTQNNLLRKVFKNRKTLDTLHNKK